MLCIVHDALASGMFFFLGGGVSEKILKKKLSPDLKKNWAELPLDKLFLWFIIPHSRYLSRPTGQDSSPAS